MTDIVRIPMDKAFVNLKRAIKKDKNQSPYVFYQAYSFLETFSYENHHLIDFEKMVVSEIETTDEYSAHWRNLHDIIHAIKAQKTYEWN